MFREQSSPTQPDDNRTNKALNTLKTPVEESNLMERILQLISPCVLCSYYNDANVTEFVCMYGDGNGHARNNNWSTKIYQIIKTLNALNATPSDQQILEVLEQHGIEGCLSFEPLQPNQRQQRPTAPF